MKSKLMMGLLGGGLVRIMCKILNLICLTCRTNSHPHSLLYQFALLRRQRSKAQKDQTLNLIQGDKSANAGEDSEHKNIRHCL